MFARTAHQNGSCRFSGQPHEALLAAGSSCLAARYTVAGVTGPRGWLSTLARGRGATPTDDSDAIRHWCSTVGVPVCRPTNRIAECSLRHGLNLLLYTSPWTGYQPRAECGYQWNSNEILNILTFVTSIICCSFSCLFDIFCMSFTVHDAFCHRDYYLRAVGRKVL